MKHILLTTDLSEEAQRAYGPALDLAKKLGAKLTLLHVVESISKVASGGMFATPITTIDVDEERKHATKKLASEVAEFGKDVEVETAVIASASVSGSIVDYANEHGVDMIAISTHGYSGLRRMVMGSIAEEIIRHSSVPVLSFPPPK